MHRCGFRNRRLSACCAIDKLLFRFNLALLPQYFGGASCGLPFLQTDPKHILNPGQNHINTYRANKKTI
jgi:hypothetical protein